MLVITTGRQAVDIDGVACIYALTYAYNLLGISTWPTIEGELAATVTDDIKARLPRFADSLPANFKDYQVGLVDVSDPKSLPSLADINRISFLIDHHVGYQEYWEHTIGSRARIEFIGSCASQVWEEIKRLGVSDNLDQLSYELLALGIVSNTLNFNATITNHRDKAAYSEVIDLLKTDINPKDYISKYYHDYQSKVEQNISLAALNDTKSINAICMAQLEVWHGLKLSEDDSSNIISEMKNQYPEDQLYLINVVLINEGINQLYGNAETLKAVNKIVEGTIYDGYIEIPELTLRKELFKLMFKKRNKLLSVEPAKQRRN